MAGYMAMARVQGGRVRTLAWDGRAASERTDVEVRPARDDAALEDSPAPTLLEQWTWFREELAMMTFFLLDPESWR
jgi:hypothetical protein